MRLVEALKLSRPNLNVRGFYTREVRRGSERVGFEVVTLDGRTAPLSSISISTFVSLLCKLPFPFFFFYAFSFSNWSLFLPLSANYLGQSRLDGQLLASTKSTSHPSSLSHCPSCR
ncbi:unnamed protein product [Linum tenue]|uniref:Uncharacterized protein n=1 Tax=Linum tenue TaxID=586396 RepID=A0AAV0KHG7_9ROSI|nr:unnamed protein product [Linum tenue]